MHRLVAGLFLVSAATVLLTAQTGPPQRPSPTFRAGIDVVQVDVSVVDRNRRPVTGLTQADFTVLENGTPQSLVAFEEVTVPGAVDPPAPWMRDVASDVATNDLSVRRVVLIVLDDAHIPFEPFAVSSAKRIAADVVHHLGPEDLAAVTFTFSGKRQDITTDRQRLLASIASLVAHPDLGVPPNPGSFSAASSRGAIPPMRGGPPPCFYTGKYRSIAGCVIDTLVHAANALATAPAGRKTLVFISNGAPLDFSADNLDAADEMNAVQELFRSLQQANIAIYAIDPAGLLNPMFAATADTTMRMDALRIFSENTGGRAIVNTNAPWEAVPQILRETSSYYLLGYRSTNPTADGRFRRIQVKVNRPDVEARTRSGYYAPTKIPAANRASTPETPLDKAFGAALPGGELTVRAAAAPFLVPGQREAAVLLTIGMRQPLSDRAVPATVRTTAAMFDEGWKPRGGSSASVGLTFPAGPGGDFDYDIVSRMAARSGRYQVRVGGEVDGQAGSVFVDVDVPDYSREPMTLSGLVLGADPHPSVVAAPDVAGLIPVQPTTLREFRAPARVVAFMRVYQGGSKPVGAVRVTSTIVNEANRPDFDETTFLESSKFTARSADYRLDLPISKLDAGAHLLTIEAALGRTVVKRQAKFTIR